jgi:hypothetical protein
VIWLNPAAWIGLLALAGPIAIHILVQRKAERLPFPSLRFLQQGRLASIRRHVLEDVLLLAIRVAIVVAAVAALAGPLIVSRTQREVWNARVVRAIVVDGVARGSSASARGDVERATADAPKREEREGGQPRDRGPENAAMQPPAFLSQLFETPTLSDGIPRAVAWLEHAPPARRELVIVGHLALGSLTADDMSAVPQGIGIRFEPSGVLPDERTVDGGELLALERDAAKGSASIVRRTVTLKGTATGVRETAAAASDTFPIEIVCSTDARPIVEAAIAATRGHRVWAPASNRRGRLVLVDASADPTAIADAGPVVESWAADAVASIARDPDLQSAGADMPAGMNDLRFSAAPWQPLLWASDGRRLAVASASKTSLIVVSGAKPSTVVTPLLLRAMVNALGGPPDLRQAEVLPIPEAQLSAWRRPAFPVSAPRLDRVERDDRRGFWVLVLALLALETWVRRATADERPSTYEEDVRVA